MRYLRGLARLLIIAATLVPVSLPSAYAHPTWDEPIPTTEDAGMQLLAASPIDQPRAPLLDAGASAGSTAGTYAAVFAADIRQGSPSTNYPTESRFYVGQKSGVVRGVLFFDLSALPPDVTINSATLQVYLVASYDYLGARRTITAYRISSWWTEFLVTWNDAPTFAEAYGSASVGHGTWGWYSLDVTDLARAWLDGTYPNYGIMLRGSENTAWRAFASDGTIYAPRLVIDYSLPEQALEVSSASLDFVVGSIAGTAPCTLRRDTQPLRIRSTTTDVLNWNATKVNGASWLSLDKESGLFSVAEPDVVQISVSTTTLTGQGVYTEQIRVDSSPAVQGSPQTIDVTFWYTGGLHVNFLPSVLNNLATSPHDYHTVALFIGIADYIYLPPSTATVYDPRQPRKANDLVYAGGDANGLSGMSFGKGSECGCCGSGRHSSLGKVTPLTPGCCGGGFRENNTLLLTEWQATKGAIREAFRWLDRWEREDTLVLISFSGHGGYMSDVPPVDEADGRDEYIVAAESGSDTGDMAGVILDDELADWLDELESNYIVVVIDSCFSGGMIGSQALLPSQRVRTIMPPSDVHLMAGDGLGQDISGPGRLIITASSETQGSWEFGALESGALSYFLIQALLDPDTDTNGDGWISFEEAFNYAAPKVDDYVYVHTGDRQNPQMFDSVDGDVKWTRP